ncbi:hypothetical protein ACXR0O_12305 [Verrucomicrobiota bacterium sgz303538]
MTSLIPRYIRKRFQVSLAVAATALAALIDPDASARSSECQKRSEETIPVVFTATASAPEGATASGEIKLKERRDTAKAELALEVTGLADGTYSVDVTLADSTTVNLGDFTVQTTRCQHRSGTRTRVSERRGDDDDEDDQGEDEDEDNDDDDDGDHHDGDHHGHHDRDHEDEGFELEIPSTVDAHSITTVTVSSVTTDDTTVPPTTTSTVLFTGDVSETPSALRFVANARVTAPTTSAMTTTPHYSDDFGGRDSSDRKSKGGKTAKVQKVKGRAVAVASVRKGVEKKRSFQFVASGAPANSTLNIVVNGQTVGTVTSTKQGNVKFRSLPNTIDFRTLDNVTITDANGVAVMQANF